MRKIIETRVFEAGKDFEALRAAERWLRENGYSVGPGCFRSPRAIKNGDWQIAKWRNLRPAERQNVDGLMTAAGGNFRSCAITVEIFARP